MNVSRDRTSVFTPRFIGQVGPADGISLLTAGLGALAGVFALIEPVTAARLILLAAIMDALDGVVARRFGSSVAGDLFDSLSDSVAFGLAPALFVLGVIQRDLGLALGEISVLTVIALAAAVVYVWMAVVRLALYTAHDVNHAETQGMQTTLAATFLTTGYLSGLVDGMWLLMALPICAYLMSIQVAYPDLLVTDAFAVGVVQFGAVVSPSGYRPWFAVCVFAFAICYATLSPRYYSGRQTTVHSSETVISESAD